MGVTIALDTTLVRIPRGSRRPPGEGEGEAGMPVIIRTYHTELPTGADGLASTVPSTEDCHGPCDVFISAAAGSARVEVHLQAVD